MHSSTGSMGHSKHRKASKPRGRLKSPNMMQWIKRNAEADVRRPKTCLIEWFDDVKLAFASMRRGK